MPKLTIGMAVYNDFDGVYFTLQALRLYHAAAMADVELIVVDNAPQAPGGRAMLEPLIGNAAFGCAGAKYIPLPGAVGTSQPRNAVFAHATGDAVVCMDSHVFLKPGAIARLIAYYDEHPDCQDLLSGPMLYDDFQNYETHFDDLWRSEMWGVWGRAWRCACGDAGSKFQVPPSKSESKHPEPLLFSVRDNPRGEHPFCEYRALKPGAVPVTLCGRCERELPRELPFSGSVQALRALGYRPAAEDEDAPAFEIPAMGLGMFTCRRRAWLGFNEHFRGFGGEEMYIHEKYRQHGRRNLSLPWLKWSHRFGRPNGVPYPLTRYNKVRNYVLGAVELGLGVAAIREHFVDSGLMPPAEWEFLLANPVAHTQEVAHAKFVGGGLVTRETRPNPSGRPLPPDGVESPAALLEWAKGLPRDLDKHLDRLAELSRQSSHVTEFSARRESTLGLLAGEPERLVSYNQESDLLLERLPSLFPWLSIEAHDSPAVPAIAETDLLFLDTLHTYARVTQELEKFAGSVRRFIVFHDTDVHGQTGQDGGPGLVQAIRDFLDAHAEWFVVSHTRDQYGLTVLGRREEDRPSERVHLWPPGYGPGTELKALLAALGVEEKPNCDCNAKALQMDLWGLAGCRAHFDEIVGWMREGQGRWGWQEKIAIAAKAVATGLAFKVNWSDPFPGLIEEAIRRAEATGAEAAAA